MQIDAFSDLSTREKQAYGALCLHRFCKAKGISHPDIDALVEHLLQMLFSDRLDEWDECGYLLELCGRGDPVPESVKAVVPDDLFDDFHRMVEFAVEIGFTNLYGEITMRPFEHLMTCLAILDEHDIPRPDVYEFFEGREFGSRRKPYMGKPYPPEAYERLKKAFI